MGLSLVEREEQLLRERMCDPERFRKNDEKKSALLFWRTENIQTKVVELLIGFEALAEFYSPRGELLEFHELVDIAEQVLGIQIKNFRQLKSRVLGRYREETILDKLMRLIEQARKDKDQWKGGKN